MCGIAGIIHRRGEVRKETLERMATALGHRGPDGRGFHLEGAVGLAHVRLSIIDLEGGRQPLSADEGKLTLIANGEIYNFCELREELENLGRRFATRSDSETILHAYAAYGRPYLSKLNGMFSFALYDSDREELLLARDRLGIKPLFYAILPDRIVFASEIKSILAALPHRPQINPNALLQFLQNQFNTGEETIFQGIYRVPPGCELCIPKNLNIAIRPYWTPLEVRPREISFEEARQEFDILMKDVMTEHLRSDVPYGLFLSGGVDSAVLLSMMVRYQSQPVKTYSVGYVSGGGDELNDAEFIAGRFHTDHTPIRLNKREIFHRLPLSVWASDDLMRDYACLPTTVLAEYASRELKVVFSGEGGDEVFSGYRRYAPSFFERAIKAMLSPGSGGFRTRGQLHPKWFRRLLNPSLHDYTSAIRRPFIDAWKKTPKNWSDLQRAQYTDLTTALPDNLLVKADRMLMAFGVEGRVPFLDHRIVEFGLSLPDHLKVQGRKGKFFLKKWAEDFLPSDYLHRKKRGFHVPVNEWLDEDFLEVLGGKLPNNRGIQEYFHGESVQALFAAKKKGQNVNREIWSLMQFAIWHKMFVDGAARPSSDEDPLDWV